MVGSSKGKLGPYFHMVHSVLAENVVLVAYRRAPKATPPSLTKWRGHRRAGWYTYTAALCTALPLGMLGCMYEAVLPFEGFSRARLFRLLISVRLTPLVCMWLVGTGFARLRETSSTGP